MAFNRHRSLISEDVLFALKSNLYDFQREAVDNAMNDIFDAPDKFKGQIILPTGAGKTKIAEYLTLKLMNEVHSAFNRPSVCGVACHRLILANNLLERIFDTLISTIHTTKINIIVVNSGDYSEFKSEFEKKYGIEIAIHNIKKFPNKEAMQNYLNAASANKQHVFFVMLYHSLERCIEYGINFDFVFCDEAHTTIEKQHYAKLEQFVNQSEVVLHMTATPSVNDTGKDMTNTDVYGDIIIEKHPRELVIGKHICPINLILQNSYDKNGEIKTRQELFSNSAAVINSIMTAGKSLFEKVEENQYKAGIATENMKQGVLFVSVTGNKHLTEMIECTSKAGQAFASWRANNDIDLYIISSEKDGWIDYPETIEVGDELGLSKEEFLKRLHGINKTRKNKSIIVFIDMLSEGVDLPDINGVLLLRQLDDNTAKIMQIIGRAVRRDDDDRKLINDDSVQFDDFDKFRKPCAYVYLPSVNFTKNESENIMNTMLKLYDAYGDIVFRMAIRENNDGNSNKLIENPDFLTKIKHNTIEDNFSYNVKKAEEIIIKLMMNIEVSTEDKINYVYEWLGKHYEMLKSSNNPEHAKILDYAKTINGDVKLFYDYIKVIED